MEAIVPSTALILNPVVKSGPVDDFVVESSCEESTVGESTGPVDEFNVESSPGESIVGGSTGTRYSNDVKDESVVGSSESGSRESLFERDAFVPIDPEGTECTCLHCLGHSPESRRKASAYLSCECEDCIVDNPVTICNKVAIYLSGVVDPVSHCLLLK